MAYKVKVISLGCGQTALSPKEVEKVAESMEEQGYSLVQVYVDVTTGCCCGPTKSLIMIFRS